MRKAILAAAAAALGIAVSGAAQADTITFDSGHGLDFETSYTTPDGLFNFSSSKEFVLNNNAYPGNADPTDDDKSDGSGVLSVVNSPFSVSLTRVGGGAFDIGSFKIDDGDGQGIDVQMSLSYTNASGTHTLPGFDTDTNAGFQTELLSLSGVSSLVFSGDYAFQLDDLNLTTSTAVTPIPPTIGLFASALAGLGFVGWRCNRNAG